MAIIKVSQWIITCDVIGCGEMEEVIWGDSNVFNKAEAIKEFRHRGWRIGKHSCSCKSCSHNLNKANRSQNEV